MLKRFLKEPLVHFLALALAIFAGYALAGTGEKREIIIVTAPKIEQMATLFTKTWQRPPSVDELKGLIDDHVKEEVLVRQALALGLDEDDAVVRRRLRQKMEFLDTADAEALEPTDAELATYLVSNADAFKIEGMLAFEQVFLNPQRRGDRAEQDAGSILQALLSDPDADRSLLGDATLLPPQLALSDSVSITQTFGTDFAKALDRAPLGQWIGPVVSSFGLHLVRVTERVPDRTPSLGEVRGAVAREWRNARRKELEDQQFAERLKGYTVIIDSLAGKGADR
ncbi:peptidylprolyl isomerase [Rhizobium binae]|uniref:peptidylprolyl isomerase n=1 Tax=Rhizobium binae TaxID=1138190 RepID=UPI001C828B3C|nr:peptidylprolyl isomerase [Rhizobium binae]MBX4940704.1 peptidyl-prolyl cis-trans isomerase [Rhizobium binae]MBX4947233.1 peptidyl-prolyl cis-trans isomerase [Rhizobium binae]MBX4983127.1 peptidyl-prolyl cis-trans isomerase [Rhizobium binae]